MVLNGKLVAELNLKKQARLPALVIITFGIVKQEIVLPIDNSCISLILLASNAVAVLTNHELCTTLSEFPASPLKLGRWVPVMFFPAVV